MTNKPIRDTFLPYARQWMNEDDLAAVIEVLTSDYLTTGPAVSTFEQAIADYVGAKFAVSFANGTAALHAACFAAGITDGDEVITTPMTFAASANCVLYQGARPVFVDIDEKTYNINYQFIEEKITNKTKAIIPVDYTGQPAQLDEIKNLAKKHHLIVIEDAAHALGATFKGKKVGSISDMTMFSFHPVKHITSGEGGMITTNNPDFYERLLLFRTHGITKDETKLIEHHGPWYYEMHTLGFNYRLTDLQAALGTSQLKRIDQFISIRKKYTELYNVAFSDIPQVTIPYQHPDSDSSWHLYVLKLDLNQLSCDRKTIFETLLSHNIGVNVHYLPVHLHPYHKQLGYKKGDFPRAEQLYESIITLPLFPAMEEKDVHDVIKAVKETISHYAKRGTTT
ncbi:UDP-4-amino-4,6-dideoxy-N-acetyl-beta-L-altrosamine transaminase [Bacillus sp. JJ1764]|uniref:UDP-4-amino-4, 6-dideoxy-N-acetyl-beta-L-altrosamine transaminase n=1 Tax=Bacillus sp. JJ1764 TaxID=3122964 RepID=UPI002FFF758C